MNSWPVVKLARNVGGGIFLRNMAGRTHDEEETYIPVSTLLSDEVQNAVSDSLTENAHLFDLGKARKAIQAAISAACKDQESKGERS